jgi:hypothetical protein
MMDLGEAA